jgi:serine/threonine protein kinase
VADFGLAKQFSNTSSKFFSKGSGTPHYMSPERINEEKYSFPSDIW